MNLKRASFAWLACCWGLGAWTASAAATEGHAAALTLQLSRTETAFWAEFNRVNTNPAYETHCSMQARFESHLQRQVCTPQFFDGATEAEAKWDLGALAGYSAAFHYPFVAPADEIVKANMKAYRNRVQVLAREDAKLARIAREYLTLRQQLDAARAAR